MTSRRDAPRRRRRTAAGLGVALGIALPAAFAVAQDGAPPIADRELLVRVTTATDEVDLGKAFPLTVVRVWAKDLAPAEWNDAALAPLVVRLAATARREDARHLEETRRYDAYAFSLGDVTVPAATLTARPRDGGAERVVSGEPVALRVRRALDPAAPGPPELPGEPIPEPFPWRRLAFAGIAATAALTLVLRARRLRAQRAAALLAEASAAVPAATHHAPPAPHERALRRIGRLRERAPQGHAETQAWYVEASGLMRDYLVERFAVCAPQMTTEEFLAAPQTARTLAAPHRALLAAFLPRCDLVKFARRQPARPERERLLASAAAFVQETAAQAAPPSVPQPDAETVRE